MEVGRYKLYEKLASGGMATIHLGCAVGAVGFSRAVVIKRLHKEYAADAEFVAMFVDEARLASRIRHPNVIPMLDVVSEAGELFLVMEYVHGEALGRLIAKLAREDRAVDPRIISSIGIGLLEGLHAAHEAQSEKGEPLGIVHRDVSPQNVLVGVDGATRVFDFGIAKAESRLYQTDAGNIKGKMAYMAPEQIQGEAIDRRADVWAAGVVLWEAVTRRRLFVGEGSSEYTRKILTEPVPPPSNFADVPPAFDAAIARALERNRDDRFATAREFAVALEEAIEPANARTVGEWVKTVAAEMLAHRAELLKTVENEGASTDPNSIRRQIAVLELENAPTVITPTGPPPPAQKRIEADMQTETSAAVVVAKGAPTPSAPPPATSVPPPQGKSGRAVPIVALVVGLGIGGAIAWTKLRPAPVTAEGPTPTPPVSSAPPAASSVAVVTPPPSSATPATTSAPPPPAPRPGLVKPRTKAPPSGASTPAPPATPATTGGGLDLDNRK